jgi:hypothetical protein
MRSSFPMILALLCACPAAPVVESTSTPTPTEPAPTAEAPALTIEFLREHTRVLSADELGGRLPGSEGARKTVEYIVTNMQALGLEPGGENGTWTQTVRMRGVTVDQALTTLELRGSKGPAMPMTFGETWVGSSFSAGSEHVLDAELVFLGYGITAPEQQWDDYAKLDVKGKIVVVFVGDPPLDDGRFGGKAMTYYGRWGYKYEAALAAGAAVWSSTRKPRPRTAGTCPRPASRASGSRCSAPMAKPRRRSGCKVGSRRRRPRSSPSAAARASRSGTSSRCSPTFDRSRSSCVHRERS